MEQMKQPMQASHRSLNVRFPISVWMMLEKQALAERSNLGRIVTIAVEEYCKRRAVEAERESR